MVVRVVGQDRSVAKRVTCKQCGAINEYHPRDVKTLSKGKDYDGGSYCVKGFECGKCNSDIITESS